MARICTKVGYAFTANTAPGVWEEQEVVKRYYGELIRNARRLESSNQVNDNVNINNRISILSDPYARENFHALRWVEFMGARWKISEAEVQYPRIILTLGGLYNDNEDEAEDGSSDTSGIYSA